MTTGLGDSAPSERGSVSILANGSRVAAVELAAFALSAASGPIVSRALGADGRGAMASVVVPIQLAGWMAHLGLPYAAAIWSDRYSNAQLMRAVAGIGAALIPIALIGAILVDAGFNQAAGAGRAFLAVGFAGVVIGLPAAVRLRLRLVHRGPSITYAVLKTLNMWIYVVSVVALALFGTLNLSAALGAWALGFVAQGVVILVVDWPARLFDGPPVSPLQLLAAGRLNFLTQTSTVLLGRSDQLILAAAVPPGALGTYAVAATAAQLTLPLASAFADTVFPHQLADRTDRSAVRRSAKMTFLASLMVALAMAALAPVALPKLFGPEFDSSVGLLWLLLPGQLCFNLGLVMASSWDARHRPEVAARAMTLAALANIVAVAMVAPIWGVAGAAIATSVCQMLFTIGVWLPEWAHSVRSTRRRST